MIGSLVTPLKVAVIVVVPGFSAVAFTTRMDPPPVVVTVGEIEKALGLLLLNVKALGFGPRTGFPFASSASTPKVMIVPVSTEPASAVRLTVAIEVPPVAAVTGIVTIPVIPLESVTFIVGLPADTPATRPVDGFTVAEVESEDQVRTSPAGSGTVLPVASCGTAFNCNVLLACNVAPVGSGPLGP